MNKTIHGIVHGKTIELDEQLELPMAKRTRYRSRLFKQRANGAKRSFVRQVMHNTHNLRRLHAILGRRNLGT
jgi:hypothetical protein